MFKPDAYKEVKTCVTCEHCMKSMDCNLAPYQNPVSGDTMYYSCTSMRGIGEECPNYKAKKRD